MTSRTSKRPAPYVLFLAAWLPALALALQMKWTIVNREGAGLDFLAHMQGVSDTAQIPIIHRLALLREDLLVAGALLPLLLLVLLRPLGARARAALVAGVSVLAMLVLFIELKSYWEVGTFVSAQVLAAGVFGSGRKYATQYIPVGSLIKLGVSVTFAIGSAWLVARLARRDRASSLAARLEQAARVLVPIPAIVAVALYLAPHPSTPFDSSAVREAAFAFAGRERVSVDETEYTTNDPAQFVASYRALTNAPVPNEPSPYWGKEAGHDVLFFFFESLPWACAIGPSADSALSTLRELRSRSFVATQHYATYPYSRRAYFSIFSGWYPTSGIHETVQLLAADHDSLFAPGAVRTAATAGYRTAMFNPEEAEQFENDDLRFQALGFERHVHPPGADGWRQATHSPDALRAWRRQKDMETLALLKKEIAEAIDRDERYMFAFNPQMTHGPWPGVESATDEAGACATGLAIYREVDGWLGQIVELLRSKGRLDRTVIVALGDHGLRTRREFPPFWGGTLDDITFHVPLQIYAPSTLDAPVEIAWMTSHVDIAPSVLDLLGMTTGRSLEQGSPMWDPRLAGRKTYFFARGYLGADGMRDGDRVTMVKYLFGGVSTSRWTGRLRFETEDLMRAAGPESRALGEQLFKMAVMQDAMTQFLVPDRGRALFTSERAVLAPE